MKLQTGLQGIQSPPQDFCRSLRVGMRFWDPSASGPRLCGLPHHQPCLPRHFICHFLGFHQKPAPTPGGGDAVDGEDRKAKSFHLNRARSVLPMPLGHFTVGRHSLAFSPHGPKVPQLLTGSAPSALSPVSSSTFSLPACPLQSPLSVRRPFSFSISSCLTPSRPFSVYPSQPEQKEPPS